MSIGLKKANTKKEAIDMEKVGQQEEGKIRGLMQLRGIDCLIIHGHK